MTKSSIRLSQCMIVKNEEKNIEKALSWGRDIVCEQIVVDTGSTDRTAELAEIMGARVVHFPWIDDFSAAKNYAIEQADGDWIALLDADEYMEADDAKELYQLLETIHGDDSICDVTTKWIHLDEKGSVIAAATQSRIFRNDPDLRYRYRIHEELYYSGSKAVRSYDAQNELAIMHTGYSRQIDMPEKGKRNARLLEMDLAENPKDAARIMYLGDSYSVAGDDDKALDCYRRVLWEEGLEQTRSVATLRAGLQVMALRMDEPAEDIEQEYFNIKNYLWNQGWASHPDIDYFIGCWYTKMNELPKAAAHFEAALEKLQTYGGVEIVRMISNIELPCRIIAAVALMDGDLQRTVSFAVNGLQANRYAPDCLNLLLRAFLAEWKEGMPVEPYWDFLCRIYDRENLKDMVMLQKFCETAGFTGLKEKAEAIIAERIAGV